MNTKVSGKGLKKTKHPIKTEPRKNNQRSSRVNFPAQGTKLDSRPCLGFCGWHNIESCWKPCRISERQEAVWGTAWLSEGRWRDGGRREPLRPWQTTGRQDIGGFRCSSGSDSALPLHKPALVNAQCETDPQQNLMLKFQLVQYPSRNCHFPLCACVSYSSFTFIFFLNS